MVLVETSAEIANRVQNTFLEENQGVMSDGLRGKMGVVAEDLAAPYLTGLINQGIVVPENVKAQEQIAQVLLTPGVVNGGLISLTRRLLAYQLNNAPDKWQTAMLPWYEQVMKLTNEQRGALFSIHNQGAVIAGENGLLIADEHADEKIIIFSGDPKKMLKVDLMNPYNNQQLMPSSVAVVEAMMILNRNYMHDDEGRNMSQQLAQCQGLAAVYMREPQGNGIGVFAHWVGDLGANPLPMTEWGIRGWETGTLYRATLDNALVIKRLDKRRLYEDQWNQVSVDQSPFVVTDGSDTMFWVGDKDVRKRDLFPRPKPELFNHLLMR